MQMERRSMHDKWLRHGHERLQSMQMERQIMREIPTLEKICQWREMKTKPSLNWAEVTPTQEH